MEFNLVYLRPREYQIVELICCRALRNRAIAEELGTTEQVVKNTFRFVIDKVGVDDRLALCVWYYNGGRERLRIQHLRKRFVPAEEVSVVVMSPVVSAAEILRRQGGTNAKS